MHVDWAALGIVTVVSIAASLVFMVLLSYGVRFVSTARVNSNIGRGSAAALSLGYAFIGLAGVVVLFCIYLIVPQFHK